MKTNQKKSPNPLHADSGLNQQPLTEPEGGAAYPEDSKSEQSTEAVLLDRIAELTQDVKRTRADFENYRKQIEAQKNNLATSVSQATVEKFLPLIDDFDRAIAAYPDQLAPLKKSFAKVLQNLQLSQIDSTPGVEFNPDLHDAISIEDGDGELEVIAETLRPGYLYNGDVIRAAMVKVKRS